MRKRKQQDNCSPSKVHPEQMSSLSGGAGGTQQINPKSRLPPRWLYCPPVGKVVAKKFLPMKTPLDGSYDHLIESPKYHFHPETVFKLPLAGAERGAKIGLWVDLTNSDNFYSGDQVRVSNCSFVKMKMVGHAQSPTPEQTEEFIKFVHRFFETNPNDIVAVHCTHGFNRTGFLISAYLYEKEGLSIEMAVREFEESRPKGIYKQQYLDDLRQRYGDEEDENLVSPGRPLWENGPVADEEFTNNGAFLFEHGNGQQQQQANGVPKPTTSAHSSSHGSASNNLPQFMDGKVPSVKFVEDPELRRSVQEKARSFCGYRSKGFPGSQPVSLESKNGNNNIRFLAEEPYMVSWKADGVRYLVLIDGKDRVFAFDRDNNPFLVEKMTFIHRRKAQMPAAGKGINEDEFVRDTLVDAEMVIDQVAVDNQQPQEVPRLLIYDLIAFQGANVGSMKFDQRFEMIEMELIRPRTEAFKTGRLRREEEPIGVRRKGFWAIQSTYKLFEPSFLNCHEIDGLIFQPINRPYTAGRFEYLMKWKPPELSSIDFRVEVKKIQRQGELAQWVGELHVLHLDRPFALIKPTKQLKELNGKIIECKFVREKSIWEFMRERTDKSHPNALSTAESVWNTINHPIHKHDLLAFISKHAFGVAKAHQTEK